MAPQGGCQLNRNLTQHQAHYQTQQLPHQPMRLGERQPGSQVPRLERIPFRGTGSQPFSCSTTTVQAQRCWIWFWTTAGEWSTNNTVNSKTVKLAWIIYSWEEILRCCEDPRRKAGQGNALSGSASTSYPSQQLSRKAPLASGLSILAESRSCWVRSHKSEERLKYLHKDRV